MSSLEMLKQLPTEKPQIFVSHSWEDKGFVQQLEDKLKSTAVEIWVDHSDIRGGDRISKRVSDALEWCNIFLLIWSRSASESKWVELEWNAAVNLQKVIIPCRLDNTTLPAILSGLAYISFGNFNLGFEQLLYALRLSVSQLHLEETYIQEIIHACVRSYRFRALERGIWVYLLDSLKKLPKISLDRKEIELAVINLVDLAIKYSRFSQKILIAGFVKFDSAIIEITFEGSNIVAQSILSEKFDSEKPKQIIEVLNFWKTRQIIELHSGKIEISHDPISIDQTEMKNKQYYKTIIRVILPLR